MFAWNLVWEWQLELHCCIWHTRTLCTSQCNVYCGRKSLCLVVVSDVRRIWMSMRTSVLSLSTIVPVWHTLLLLVILEMYICINTSLHPSVTILLGLHRANSLFCVLFITPDISHSLRWVRKAVFGGHGGRCSRNDGRCKWQFVVVFEYNDGGGDRLLLCLKVSSGS